MFHELNSVSSLLCIAQNVRFEIPYKDLYFETPFLMIFKYYAWASYGHTTNILPSGRLTAFEKSFLSILELFIHVFYSSSTDSQL